MTSNDLTIKQLERIHAALTPGNRYLHELLKRMQFKAFPVDDPLFVAAQDAERAVTASLTEVRRIFPVATIADTTDQFGLPKK